MALSAHYRDSKLPTRFFVSSYQSHENLFISLYGDGPKFGLILPKLIGINGSIFCNIFILERPKTWILRSETEKSGPHDWRINCLIVDLKHGFCGTKLKI